MLISVVAVGSHKVLLALNIELASNHQKLQVRPDVDLPACAHAWLLSRHRFVLSYWQHLKMHNLDATTIRWSSWSRTMPVRTTATLEHALVSWQCQNMARGHLTCNVVRLGGRTFGAHQKVSMRGLNTKYSIAILLQTRVFSMHSWQAIVSYLLCLHLKDTTWTHLLLCKQRYKICHWNLFDYAGTSCNVTRQLNIQKKTLQHLCILMQQKVIHPNAHT